MNEPLSPLHEPSAPFPQRMPDGPAITVDLEALVGRSFIESLMERVTDFQENEYAGDVRIDWQAGTYYTGVFAAYLATGNNSFRNAAMDWCRAAKWKVGERPFYADDICMGQTMLDLYLLDPNPVFIADLKRVLEDYFGRKTVTALDVHSHFLKPGDHEMRGRNLWWWSDALYMAPPVLARMSSATGDRRYLDLLHRFFWDTHEFLFDKDSSLYYRDESFFPKERGAARERDKIFWSRGNGWVYAGLVRILDSLPEADPYRHRYLGLFQTLTRKLVTLQRNNGLWPSWLNRPDLDQSPEVSGSCFFTFGLLAGIHRGWLDKRSYLPLALRAWRGLTAKLGTDGRLGFAQLVDSAPGPVRPESSIDYTHGGFLLAASELHAMNLCAVDLRSLEPARQPQLMMSDASWDCLSSDRAVLADRHVYLGAVNGGGLVNFHAYRIDPNNAPSILNGSSLFGSVIQHGDGQHPALLRFDDKLLAVYPASSEGISWNWRIAKIPRNLPEWGAMKIQWSDEKAFSGESFPKFCSGLACLSAENRRIFHFFGNSGMTWSDDGGTSWRPAVRLVDSAEGMLKISSNGRDRVDLLFIGRLDEGVAHLFYQNGMFHTSDGKPLRTVDEIGGRQIRFDEMTLVAKGSVHDLKSDDDGTPVALFAQKSSNGELQYSVARWNGTKWCVRQIAFAGSALDGEDLITAAGIALDPDDVDLVYLSSNVDPATGAANATGRYQLFRGNIGLDMADVVWEQLTFDPNRDNLRPFVSGSREGLSCVLWLRGTWRSNNEFQTDIYGLLESASTRVENSIEKDPVVLKPSVQRPSKSHAPSGVRQAV